MKLRFLAVTVAAGALIAAISIVSTERVDAADHTDSPSVTEDAASDINDLFAWVEGDKLIVAMTVFPFAGDDASFSDAVLYSFFIRSQDDVLAPTATSDTRLTCSFDAAGAAECWLGDMAYATGDPSTSIASDDGSLRVFAGLRDDPFYFNLSGFQAVVDFVVENAAGLTFDTAGCPDLNAAQATAIVTQLQNEPDPTVFPGLTPGVDDFRTQNVLAIVAEIDLDSVNASGNILGVWATTNSAAQ